VHILEEERVRYGFQLFGYVVMPEHVHLLLSEPERGDPSKVLQALKQRVSRALRRRSRRKATEQLAFAFKEGPEDARAFWQRRVYDFNVWSAKKVFEKLEYMHENQVKRGLVCSAKDWRWSSWSHYARKGKGIIAID
jgi:putative transposase